MRYATKPSYGSASYSRLIVPLATLALTAGCATKSFVRERVEDVQKRTDSRVEEVVGRTAAVEGRVDGLEKTTQAVEKRVDGLEGTTKDLVSDLEELSRQPIVEGPISVTGKDYPREFESLVRAVISQYENRDAKRLIWHAYREGNLIIELAPYLNGETYSATSNLDYNNNGVAGRGDRTVMDRRSNGQTYGSVTLFRFEIPERIRGELPAIEPSSRHERRHRR
jgi:hypothetical protein